MNFILFQFRRFFTFLADSFLFPIFKFRELWSDPKRGRALLFGMPAMVVAILAIACFFLSISSSKRFADNYENAKTRAIKEKEWDKAIIYQYKLSHTFRSDRDDELWELARVLREDDRAEVVESNSKVAQAILESLSPTDKPRYPKAHVWRANRLLNSRRVNLPVNLRMEMAAQQLEFALSTDPDDIDAKILLAERIHIPRREYEQALSIYKELFKTYEAYYVKIAELLVRLKRPTEANPFLEEAIERYTELLKEDPKNVDYLRRRANALAMLSRHDEGASTLVDAIDNVNMNAREQKQLQEALSRIHLAHAMVFAPTAQEEFESREQFLNYLILAYQTDPENIAATTELTRFGLSDFEISDRAVQVYDPRDDPESATDQSLEVVGTWEVLKGDKMLGISLLELAIQKNPRNHEALNNLAFTLMDSNVARAFELANRAVLIKKTSAHYLDTRATIYMRMGEYNKAINDFEKAVDGLDDAGQVRVLEALVTCYTEIGLLESAAIFQRKVDEMNLRQPPS